MSFVPERVSSQISRLSVAVPGTPAGCIMWTGATDREGYGRIKVTWSLPGGTTAAKYERAPRIAFMVKVGINSKSDFPQPGVTADGKPDPLEVSHLCHQRLCVNPDHLILEPGSVNSGRRHCHAQNRCCKDHERYPNCLIW